MINQLLNLTRPLFVLDTETTGTDPKTDRVVELAFEQWGPEGLVKEWSSRINPCIPIPLVVTKIHGITDADVVGKPTFKQLAANLAKGFSDCDFCGKNVRYDLRILAAEMARAKQPWDYAKARIVDAERLEQLAVPRDLGSLHEKYVGRKHDGAHGALSDVRASTTVIVKQLETYPNLPRDLEALHNAQWPGWLCDGGEFRMVDGVATCQFGKWRGKAMRDIEPSYWDWVLKSDFPADVKALVSAAKLGNFPGDYAPTLET